MRKRTLFALLSALATATALAQSAGDDFGADVSIEVEKKLAKRLSLGVEGNFRTQNDSEDPERWRVGVGLSYKFFQTADKKFSLKANAGFEYIWKYYPRDSTAKYDDFNYDDNGKLIGTPDDYWKGYNEDLSHWRNRYRAYTGVSGTYSPSKRWSFQLKETVQYNHYCKATHTENKWRLNDDDEPYLKEQEKESSRVKDRWVLRSKLTTEYNVKGLPFNPYASIDYGCGLNYSCSKWKYTVGCDWKVTRAHKVSLFYRYQTENDDDEPDGHIVGLSYKLSL